MSVAVTDFCLVIVHRNRAAACLTMIGVFAAQSIPVRIVVVDNDSDAAQLDELRRGLPASATLLETGSNLGFGPGANVGLRHWLADESSSEWALLAPHDVDAAPDCLERLAAGLAGEPMAGLACGDVGDGQTPMLDPYFGGVTRPARCDAGWEPADYPHGTLMALRRGCVEEVGLFDERFFAYCEEADLGLRARRAGWKVGLVRGARVTNTHLSSSVALVDYLQQRNTLLLVREMSGRYHTMIRTLITLWHLLRGWLQPQRRPPVFDARGRLLGMRDFYRSRFGPPPPEVLPPS
ncbi:MAG TPA: glycosyltransferase [Microthrixaceae bacterium]|nr:glycosyltransferase [Microthrixaceae bacterium]